MFAKSLLILAMPWLAMCGSHCTAQVTITPRNATVLEGRTCAFRIRTVSGQAPDTLLRGLGLPGAWLWTILDGVGTIDATGGRYTAPAVSGPCLVKVRATCLALPSLQAETRILVLPFQPFDTIDKVLGDPWLQPIPSELPFLNPATGRRYGEPVQVLPWQPELRRLSHLNYGGCGQPITLTWPRTPGAEAEVLAIGAGPMLPHSLTDVTGMSSVTIDALGHLRRYTVEALKRVPGTSNTWLSQTGEGAIHLRGLALHAGNDLLDPGHQDGRGLAARFMQPFGLARVPIGQEGYRVKTAILVSDPQAHVIRLLAEDGRVSTPWGQPCQPGHQDSRTRPLRRLAGALCLEGLLGPPPPEETLFDGPTFLWVRASGCSLSRTRTWTSCLVADSGNHVIRVLHPDGTVATLAGVPGRAGHRDWPHRKALFNRPQGLVEDALGDVYVADQGNQVIRIISPIGIVTTLAGSPGQAGDQDGTGSEARFTCLKGMCLHGRQPACLYVVDGHAIRRVRLPGGEVTTVLGSVTIPGFRDIQGGALDDRRQGCRQPCLNDPCGLLVQSAMLLIADQGNHCVRQWSLGEQTLTTVVGDPTLEENRWGLPRDGTQAPPGSWHAALEAPRTLVAFGGQPEEVLVTTGSCLGRLSHALEFRDRLRVIALDCTSATQAEPCVVRFTVEARTTHGEEGLRPMRYSVDFLEPDGSLADHMEGRGVTSTPISVQGVFEQRGTGAVVVRCLTDEGVGTGCQRAIVIQSGS